MKLKLFISTVVLLLSATSLADIKAQSTATCSLSGATLSINSTKRLPQPPMGDCTYDVVVNMTNSVNGLSYTFSYIGDGTVVSVITPLGTLPGTPSFMFASTGGPIMITFVVEAPCTPIGTAGAFVRGENTGPGGGAPDDCGFGVMTPLPVELSRFEAKSDNSSESIILSWITNSELDNEGFEIQRSKDAKNWQVLDFVEGAGTTTEEQKYQWHDDKPLSLAYYRLKQMDYSGQFEYSHVVAVEIKPKEETVLTIFPNPTTGQLNWNIDAFELVDARLLLHDQYGRLIRQWDAIESRLSIADLPKGFYIFTLQNGHQRFYQRVVKT